MQLPYVRIFLAGCFSHLITIYIVPLCIQLAQRFNIFDIPDGKIKNHASPIPYLGGIAIYLGFIFSIALFCTFNTQILFLLVGSTILLFLGLIDDLLALKHYQKFIGQSIAAYCYFKSGFCLKELFFLNNVWCIPISIFWILSIINAFNLIDIMDGLATTVAIMAALNFLLFALLFNQTSYALILAAFLGSLIGFFYYNKPNAQIYLGDTGSLYIGGFLAAIPFLLPWSVWCPWGFVAPAFILAVPLLELLFLVGIRTYKKIPFYNASPDHFAIQLLRAGWSKLAILYFIFIFAVVCSLIAWAVVLGNLNIFNLAIAIIILPISWFFIVGYRFSLAMRTK